MRNRYLVLAVLTATLMLSYVDRYVLAVLVEPIKADLGLSDGQIGLLTGLAFALFYASVGLPMARLADRGFHRAVITGSVLVWSAVTALTSLAGNFVQMALARFAVGAGEAGVFPTSQAIIADQFPPERRTSAMAIFAAGGSIGLMIAFAAGAALEARFGWRGTFVIMALPGLVVAPLVWLIIPRGNAKMDGGPSGRVAGLWANPHFRHLPFAQSAVVILLFGQAQWLPAWFERSFDVTRADIGTMLGPALGAATILGSLAGGFLSDRIRPRGEAAPLWLAIFSLTASLPFVVLLYSADGFQSALVFAAITSFLFAVPTGPITAHLQFVVRPEQRATAAAWAVLVASLLGGGGGPLLIGMASDFLAAGAGETTLGTALPLVLVASLLWALWHLWRLIRIPDAMGRLTSAKGIATPIK